MGKKGMNGIMLTEEKTRDMTEGNELEKGKDHQTGKRPICQPKEV